MRRSTRIRVQSRPLQTQITSVYNANGIVKGGSSFNSSPDIYNDTDGALDFTVTGMKLTVKLQCINAPNTWQIFVDGVPFTPTIPTNVYTDVVVFDLPFQVTRRIQLRVISSYCTYSLAGVVATVTGRPPSISQPYLMQNTYKLSTSTAFIQTDGTMNTAAGVGGDYGTMPVGYQDSSLRFLANCSAIGIWMNAFNGATPHFNFSIAVDGTEVTQTTIGATSRWNWYQLIDGLDPTTQHEYRLTQGTLGQLQPWQLSVQGTVNASALTANPLTVFYGDSITEPGLLWPYKVALAKGWGCANQGLSYRTVSDNGGGASSPYGSYCGKLRTSVVTAYTAAAHVVILMGTNDAGGVGGVAYNAATFLASYQSMLTSIRAGLPTAKITCLAMLPTSKSPHASNRNSVLTQIQQAITNIGDSNIVYVSTDGWIDPTSFDGTLTGPYDTIDGLHPYPLQGQAKMLTRLLALSL